MWFLVAARTGRNVRLQLCCSLDVESGAGQPLWAKRVWRTPTELLLSHQSTCLVWPFSEVFRDVEAEKIDKSIGALRMSFSSHRILNS